MRCFFCGGEINLTIAFLRGKCNACGRDFTCFAWGLDELEKELQLLADGLKEHSEVDKAIASDIEAILSKYKKGGETDGRSK